jgi:hypothetical protein
MAHNINKESKMPRYLVETVSNFRLSYWVEASEPGHAADEVLMHDATEFTQRHLDEVVFNIREISDEDAEAEFFQEHPYLADTNVDILEYLHKIKY